MKSSNGGGRRLVTTHGHDAGKSLLILLWPDSGVVTFRQLNLKIKIIVICLLLFERYVAFK